MAIDFPNAPAPGATFTANAKTWTFTGGKWLLNVSVGGVTGPTGSTGATGPQGAVGATGPQGAASTVAGPQGAVGPTGPQGAVGPTGAAGAAGTNGTNGTNGAVGPTGPTGPAGPGANQSLNTFNGVTFAFVDVGGDGYRSGGGMTSSTATLGVVRRSDGIFCTNGASSVSKRQYKNNIVDIENALPSILGLRPRNFKWTDELVNTDSQEDVYDMQTQQQYGFIVEEVAETLSDLVHHEVIGSAFEPQMWKSNAVLALAVKAIQELSAQVETLKLEINEIKGS